MVSTDCQATNEVGAHDLTGAIDDARATGEGKATDEVPDKVGATNQIVRTDNIGVTNEVRATKEVRKIKEAGALTGFGGTNDIGTVNNEVCATNGVRATNAVAATEEERAINEFRAAIEVREAKDTDTAGKKVSTTDEVLASGEVVATDEKVVTCEFRREESETNVRDAADSARILFQNDKVLAAGRILQKVPDTIVCGDEELSRIRNTFQKCDTIVDELLSDPDTNNDAAGDEWMHQRSGTWWKSPLWGSTSVKYKIQQENGPKLTALISTPIDRSLLVPLLSVLNESELYSTWMPNWRIPIRLRVRRSKKLLQTGRCSQIVLVTIEMPWPVSTREVVLEAVAFDDIDPVPGSDNNSDCTQITQEWGNRSDGGMIGIRLDALQTGDKDGFIPPPEEKETVRVGFKGGFLFRNCPKDYDRSSQGTRELLVTFLCNNDPKISFVPERIMNFFVRTAIGMVWNKLLKVSKTFLLHLLF
mmetsp:Transcript_25315/g.58471  ORF Transcript_25315/g.58471 Transcript_25315/m.58471 type:complete len:476 (-) Transcript_25315:488-1915(-)